MRYLIIILVFLILYFNHWSKVCSNPYDMSLIFGKKGSGKTTLLQKLTLKYIKQGWKVYSNVELFGAYKFNADDFGKIRFPENSVIVIDEVSLLWSNRDFREWNKKRYIEEYMRYIRHYHNKVILCSQNFDIDRKARLLCDNLYLLSNYGGFLTVAKKIKQRPTLHTNKDNDNGTSNENFITEDFNYYLPFSWIFTFNPRYFKFFNSFNIPSKLPLIKNKYYEYDNYDYLIKYTDYKFYKKENIKALMYKLKDKYIAFKYSFIVNDEFIMNLGNS